jgi:hypothetical protein
MALGTLFEKNPTQIDAYLKRAAGWTTITELTSGSVLTATVTASAGANFNHFYRCVKPAVPTEYFIIENRQQTGHDANIPGAGVLVWHVDELGDRNKPNVIPNTTHNNYELTLIQADNLWDMQNKVNKGDANDPYYCNNPSAGYNNQLTDTSAPKAQWWDGTASGVNFHDFSCNADAMTFLVGSCTITCPSDVTQNNDPGQCGAVVNFPAPTASGNCATVTCTPASGSFFPVGTTPVTCDAGTEGSCSFNVTVNDTEPPNISCPSPIAECTGPNGAVVSFSPTVSDNCAGVTYSCNPPSGSVFPFGTTPLQCVATDSSGNTNSCNSVVKVVDTTAPVISSLSASPNVLWPPNHKMTPVTVAVSASDVCSPPVTCKITSVTSNEPVNAPGSGSTAPDWQITGDRSVNLRAERSGRGNGRIYTLTVQCTDASGNGATKTVTVNVSHDQGKKK